MLIEGRLSIREDDDVKIVANSITEFNENTTINNAGTSNVFAKRQTANGIGKNETVRPKMIIINITNLPEEQKSKLRGAIKFFSGDRNNISISVKNEDKILPCGAIYLTEEILKQFEEIVGKENIEL